MSEMNAKILGLSARWARRLLVLSLVVNFLILGAVVGLGMRKDDGKTRGVGRHVVGEITQIIGEDRRPEAKRILEDRRGNQRRFRAQRREDWRAVADLIDQPDFDADTLRAMLNRQADVHHEARRASLDPLVRVVALMTAEERAAFSARIRSFVDQRSREKR